MRSIRCALSIAAMLALAGCGTNEANNYGQGPMLGAMTPPASADMSTPGMDVANTPAPAQVVTAGVENLDIATFTDPNGLKAMGPTAKSEATSAQYYALQFGRVGAARTWSGENGVTGQISVGPYVKVNNRDCRDFTNVVNSGSRSYTKRGTACREVNGTWSVGLGPATGMTPAAPAAASGIGASG